MHLYLFGLIIPFISYFSQSYPRFFNRYFGVDVWTRMIEADLIRTNHHKIPIKKVKKGFLIEGYFNYPPFFPWILSFFNKKQLFELQGFISPFFDSMQNFIVFLIAMQITNKLEIALFAQLIYATIPLIILENSYLTPRSLGYLNFTLSFYPLLLYSVSGNIVLVFISYVFTCLVFFTHKFATQSLFFVCIFFSLFERNPFYILYFLLSLFSVIVFSKGYYLRVLHGHIANMGFWVKNYHYRFAHQVRGLVKKRKTTDFVGQIYYILGIFTPVTLIGTNLWILVPFFFIANNIYHIVFIPYDSQLLSKFAVWSTFFYIIAISVLTFKILTPIGEGQRYLEMATVPTAILASITFFSFFQTPYQDFIIFVYITIIIVNLTLTIIIQWKGIIEDRNRSLTKDMEIVFSFLNSYPEKPRILCIPHQITTMILYNTKADVLVDIEAGTLTKIDDVFPILKKSVKEIAKKYNLNLLVLKKHYTSSEELGLSKNALLLDTENTQVLKI